ncbi:Hypothetical predicted protein [Paramuricea clavata]|uniref:Uncharacterized protein n=1 Tax=Paramuricea clavata TaxID=317549 RepID=A0A7D9EQE1_PARCT|nr:Hypothetical predicted protein [Paramuricea clavata]
MLASSITLVLLSAVLPAFMAPTRKPDVPLTSDILKELKTFQSQFGPLQDEFKKIIELAVDKGTPEQSEKPKEPAEKQKTEEKDKKEDDFILRVALKVAGKLSVDDPLEIIERLVNLTSNYLVAKMNASHDRVNDFQSKLLGAVTKILNEPVLKYEPPMNKSLHAASKENEVSKISQLVKNKYVPEAFQKSQEKKDEAKDKRSFDELPKDEDGVLFALLGHLEKWWHQDKKGFVQYIFRS